MPGAPADLSKYANQFDELRVEERTPVIDLNAINPLSNLRDGWQNASNTATEHKLSTTADTNDLAYLETDERGQYTSGYEVQCGVGIRVPAHPTGDSTVRWGYYESDSNDDPLNGFYFGVDSTGVFVAKVRGGSEDKVYQDSWNTDRLNGDGGATGPNPSNRTLDLSNGVVTQVEFVYYGYGAVKMQMLLDEGGTEEKVTVHTFNVQGKTSIENTNLPLRQEVASGGTSNDALDVFVGGRQFSIIGKRTSNKRVRRVAIDSLSIDDTKWHHAVSIKLKDGSGGADGSIDFRHVLSEVFKFTVDVSAERVQWMMRRNTTPDNPSWNQSPPEIDDDEVAVKYDVNSDDVLDGSGNLTGDFINGDRLASGKKNEPDIRIGTADSRITDGSVFTLLFRVIPASTTSTLNDIVFKWDEDW